MLLLYYPEIIGINEMNQNKKYNNDCQITMLLNRMISNCNRITQELNRQMKNEMSLTLAKYEVLIAIKNSDDGQITMSNLSQKLSVSNANMTGMTGRLLKDELIEKKAFPKDRRIFSLALTDKGYEILEKAQEKYGHWTSEIFQNIDANDLMLANIFINKIDESLENFSEKS
jgi:DNA-binding MarR family transcriptional regulator